MPPPTPTTRRRLSVLLATALAVSACFEPPVLERLDLRFLTNGAVVVTSRVEVAEPKGGGWANPALKRRLAETRRALLDGSDAWSARFAALEPAAERSSWEKRLGELWRAEHAAALAEPGELSRFFSDTDLTVDYRIEGDRAELTIAPDKPSRASRRQRHQVERAMAGWTAAVAEYLEAARGLYEYVEKRPDRARACFGALFREAVSEEVRAKLPELSPEEARRVEAVSEAMERVWEVLEVRDGESHSLDELSHLVHDPLPASLRVKLPSPALEVEGFEAGPEGALAAEGPGLWTALRALQGHWISPDPLLLFVAQGGQGGDTPFDLDGFLRQSRRAQAPTAGEVRREIEARLAPQPLYRAVWKVDPDAEEDFRWE